MPAGSATINLTATGPQPNVLSVSVGDTVQFVNVDSDNHSIISRVGGFTSPVITPGQTFSVVAGRAGKLGYEQTGFSHHNYRALIEVGVPAIGGGLTLSAERLEVPYGAPLVLSGYTSLPPGSLVSVFEKWLGGGVRAGQFCRKSGQGNAGVTAPPAGWTASAAPVPVASDGSFRLTVRVTGGTVFEASGGANEICSPSLQVSVRPLLSIRALTRAARAGHTIVITGAMKPASVFTALTLARFDRGRGTWKKIETQSVSSSGLARFVWSVTPGQTF